MPVSLSAARVILAEQDHGAAIAGIGFVWIANADRLNWLDRTRLTLGDDVELGA